MRFWIHFFLEIRNRREEMFDHHYIGWRASRMKGVEKYVGDAFFSGKTLLEVGAGYGHNGDIFHKKGCVVTCTDARPEHVEAGKAMHPHLDFQVLDCEKDLLTHKYDILLHWGVLYHLSNIEDHFAKMAPCCDYLLLETEVCDSNDESIVLRVDEEGFDQAYHKVGSRPSQAYVEKLLEEHGFSYKRIMDPILNFDFHTYDWVIENTKKWKHGLRRYWIAWKHGVESPLRV